MREILLIMIVFISFISCQSDGKQKLLEKENERSEKELEPQEKESNLDFNIDEKTKIAKPKLIDDLIPDNYQIIDTENGRNLITTDLNNDGIIDFVAIVAKPDKDEKNYEDSEDVRIIIFHGTSKDKYIKKAMSGNMTAAFIYNNLSNPQIEVNNKVIILEHQSMRHHYELKIRYEKKQDNYMLIGSELNNYGNAVHDGAGNISSNFLSKKRIIDISEYDHDLEELITPDPKKETIKNYLIPISAINDSNIYELLTGE